MRKLTFVVEKAINNIIKAKTPVDDLNAMMSLRNLSEQMSQQAVDVVKEDFIERGLIK